MPSLRQLLSQLDPDQLRALGQNRGVAMDNPNPQVLTPTNREAITRPRTVTQPVDQIPPKAVASIRDMMARQSQQPIQQSTTAINDTPPPMRQMQPEMNPLPTRPFSMGGQNVAGEEATFGSGEPFAADGRPRRTQMRDFIADDSQYLRDLENKPRNWKDKVVDTIRALDTNLNGRSASPPTRRERDITQAQGALGRDVAVNKAQTAAELSSLVPVELEDGSTVMVPRRGAGALQSQQQGIGTARARVSGYLDHLKTLKGDSQKKLTAQLFKTGALNTPEGMKYAAEVFGIPEGLQEAFIRGEHRDAVDDNGNFVDINRRTGASTDTGVTSYDKIKEDKRNERRDKNAVDAMERTRVIAASGAAKMGDVPELEKTQGMLNTYADEKEQEAADLADSNLRSDKDMAAKLKSEATQYRLHAASLGETIAKARGAQAGSTPAPASGRTIEGAVKAFTKKTRRAPTAEETAKMQAALKQ